MCPSFLLFCALLLWSHLFSRLPCSDFSIKNGHLHSPEESFQAETPLSCWCPVIVRGLEGVLPHPRTDCQDLWPQHNFPVWWRMSQGGLFWSERIARTPKCWKRLMSGLQHLVGILGGSGQNRESHFHITSLIVKFWRRGGWFLWLCCLFFSFLLYFSIWVKVCNQIIFSFLGYSLFSVHCVLGFLKDNHNQ